MDSSEIGRFEVLDSSRRYLIGTFRLRLLFKWVSCRRTTHIGAFRFEVVKMPTLTKVIDPSSRSMYMYCIYNLVMFLTTRAGS